MQEILRFPLPKKPIKHKHPAPYLTPTQIIYTIESVKEDNLPLQHVPVILSYTFKGILSLKETAESIIVKVVDDEYECAYLIKKSSFRV